MKTAKLLLGTTLVCCVLSSLLLTWCAKEVTCDVTTLSVFQSMFLIVAIMLTREITKMRA